MRERRSEDGHDGVPNKLLDRAAEALDLAADTLVIRGEAGLHLLGVGLFRGRGEADEIAKEDGDDLALPCERRRSRA
jgi:hypothetical protein